MTINAVIINNQNDIIGLLDETTTSKEIRVAGAIAIDGAPVNVNVYRVSTSKKNLARSLRTAAEFVSRHQYRGQEFVTINT